MHYFGEVVNNKMNLSNIGVLADVFWYEIKNHSKNITLGEFVVMPNHMHGILIINPDPDNGNIIDSRTRDGNIIDPKIVQTRHALSLRDPDENYNPNENPKKSIGENRFQNPGQNSISSIIGSYKSAVTKHANRLNFDFGWQTRCYDHIIRDERAFATISNYISNNPAKWGEDKFRS